MSGVWKRRFVPDRTMGMLLRAVFAFFVAYSVYAPDKVAACFDTPRFNAVRAELADERPVAKLGQAINTWFASEQLTEAMHKRDLPRFTIERPE